MEKTYAAVGMQVQASLAQMQPTVMKVSEEVARVVRNWSAVTDAGRLQAVARTAALAQDLLRDVRFIDLVDQLPEDMRAAAVAEATSIVDIVDSEATSASIAHPLPKNWFRDRNFKDEWAKLSRLERVTVVLAVWVAVQLVWWMAGQGATPTEQMRQGFEDILNNIVAGLIITAWWSNQK